MKSGTFRNWPIARKLNTVLLLVTTLLFGVMTVVLSTYVARVLKDGGKLLVLEFSQVARPLRRAYDLAWNRGV